MWHSWSGDGTEIVGEIFEAGLAQSRVAQRELDVRLQISQGIAGVVMVADKRETVQRAGLAIEIQRIGELNFAASIFGDFFDRVPDGRLEKITAENTDTRRSAFRRRFFDQTGDLERRAGGGRLIGLDDTVALDVFEADTTDGDEAASV